MNNDQSDDNQHFIISSTASSLDEKLNKEEKKIEFIDECENGTKIYNDSVNINEKNNNNKDGIFCIL